MVACLIRVLQLLTFFEDLSTNPTSYGWQTYTIDGSYYLLDLSLQYNINSNAALHNKKFKGLKAT